MRREDKILLCSTYHVHEMYPTLQAILIPRVPILEDQVACAKSNAPRAFGSRLAKRTSEQDQLSRTRQRRYTHFFTPNCSSTTLYPRYRSLPRAQPKTPGRIVRSPIIHRTPLRDLRLLPRHHLLLHPIPSPPQGQPFQTRTSSRFDIVRGCSSAASIVQDRQEPESQDDYLQGVSGMPCVRSRIFHERIKKPCTIRYSRTPSKRHRYRWRILSLATY